ncbi:MAG TPA: diguanylate cyclase [Candidatus Hydrogenedens sp.]|nr:diguanylate cyclase [Candidatus Hydrogenedens sp.]
MKATPKKKKEKGILDTLGKKEDILKRRIFVIDDDEYMIEYFKNFLPELGYNFYSTTSPKEALSILTREPFDLAIVDYLMPEIDGLELLKKAKAKNPDIEIIIMTGLQDVKTAIEALRLGAYDYITKPFSIEEIKIAIKRALEHHTLILENKNYEQKLEQKIKEATKQLENINRELRETKEYLEQLLNTSVDGIFILTPNFKVSYANQGALNILNITEKEILEKNLSTFLSGSKKESRYINQLLFENGIIQNYETELIRKDKTQVPVNISFSPFKKDSKQIHSILAIFKDITTQKKLESQLTEMSIKDGLTNLYNQRYFYEQLESEIERAKRQRYSLSLLLFDIDQFKTYNDRYGHLEGDKVLKAVGQIVRQCTREHVDMGFRYGGDEFTVILPETDEAQAIRVADRIRVSFASKKFDNLTLSIGVISYKEIFSTNTFIKFADNCMYSAKFSGGNCVKVFKNK